MSFRDLQFLTDENIDAELISFLRERGFDVLDIKEEHLFRLSDLKILEMALAQRRVVISQDSDFGTLVFRDKNPFWVLSIYGPAMSHPLFIYKL